MGNSTPEMAETLVRLLDGELSGEEKTNVEKQLANDALLQQEYDSLLATRAAVRYYGLKQQVGTIHHQMMDEFNMPLKKTNPVRKLIRYTTAIAAGVLLVVGGFFAYQYFSLTPEKVFSANYQVYELSTARGAVASSAIEDAYRQKKYELVIQLYNAASEKSIKNDFLAAVAALEMNNLSLATARFRQVLERNNKEKTAILKDEAEYYFALTLIRQKEYKAALQLLERIKDDAGHTYHAKVNNGLFRDVRKLSRR